MMNFVFDVDGTLTPSRGEMYGAFKSWFLDWAKGRNVYLITGSDYAKTVEQVGEEVTHAVNAVYNCAGNSIYVRGQLIYKSDWHIGNDLRMFLEDWLEYSSYPTRTGTHIEERIGLCNFSIVGRGATKEQRAEYVKWDTDKRERYEIAEALNKMFPDVEATVAGEIGIDIYKRGKDKAQVADVLSPFVFFGDKTGPGGNDHTISLRADKVHSVYGWSDTWQVLRFMYPTENQ